MQQEQYFKAVPVSENPKQSGKYMALEVNHGPAEWRELRYDKFNNSWFDGADSFHPTHYLQPIPIPIPDAAVLRSALEKIIAGHETEDLKKMLACSEMAAIAREALSAGDGWVRCEDGLPEKEQYCWGLHKDDSIGFYLIDKNGFFYYGEETGKQRMALHYRPVAYQLLKQPSPPLKK